MLAQLSSTNTGRLGSKSIWSSNHAQRRPLTSGRSGSTGTVVSAQCRSTSRACSHREGVRDHEAQLWPAPDAVAGTCPSGVTGEARGDRLQSALQLAPARRPGCLSRAWTLSPSRRDRCHSRHQQEIAVAQQARTVSPARPPQKSWPLKPPHTGLITPKTIMAPPPSCVRDHSGPELCCFALMPHHCGQVTVDWLATRLAH